MPTDKLKIYLAGPFFNHAQRSLIKALEMTLERLDYEVWSPSRDGIALPPDASNEDQKRVFDMNYHAINTCDMMVAALEPNDTRMVDLAESAITKILGEYEDHIDEDTKTDIENLFAEEMRVAQKPRHSDVGTIWEMGVAYELGKPTVAYYETADSRPNLMLAKSCHGLAIGLPQLGVMVALAAKGVSSEYVGEIT